MSNKMILAGAALVFSLSASVPAFAQGQGVVPQDDSAGILTPFEVIPQQLGVLPRAGIQEGRSVGIGRSDYDQPYSRDLDNGEPAIPGAGRPDR